MKRAAMHESLVSALVDARRRLMAKGLFAAADASLSLRVPGDAAMLFAAGAEAAPRMCTVIEAQEPDAALHAAVYALRPDVGAIVAGGAGFGRELADFGSAMPALFDEQARHLGRMRVAAADASPRELAAALDEGGNALLVRGVPLCLGATCQRMVFNAELFEKCAKAYVLAAATGASVTTLPWWVSHIANGRLMKDERRAAQRFGRGLLPEEVRGY